MMLRYLLSFIPVLVLCACVLVGSSGGNSQACSLDLYFTQQHLSVGSVLLEGVGIGLLCGLLVIFAQRAKQKGQENKLAQWEAQDVKLAAEVKSDREKQLEAKISTLEAALKTALKNS